MTADPRSGPRAGEALALLVAGIAAAAVGLLQPWWGAAPLSGLALALQAGSVARMLGHAPDPAPGAALGHRLSASLLGVLAAVALLGAVVALPLFWLARDLAIGAVLALSLAVAIAWLGLWRIWPLWLLPWIDALPARRRWAFPAACWRSARRLVDQDPSFARGMLAALLVLLLLAVPAVLIGSAGQVRGSTRWALALGWWCLLAPPLHFVLAALIEPARLAARPARGWPQTGQGEGRPEAVPLPPDLGQRAEGRVEAPADPSARLRAAARLGRVEEALAALDAGADPHRLPAPGERDQRTLLMLAAILPDTRLLRRLIAAGVDVNLRHQGLTPLLAATRDSLRGRVEAVITLLANGADPRAADGEGRTALHFAALVAEPDVAALLIDAGAPLDALNRDGFSPLGVACAAGNWRLARFLLERKARPEPPGGQPALLAAAAGDDDPAGVELLLRHRARVDARGRLGRTALLTAALAGNTEIVAALLAAGADPNLADDHGITPLLEAARAGAKGVLERLERAGARVDAVDPHGRNALVLACQSPKADAETVRRLLAMGVDPAQPAHDGRRALDCALAQGRWPHAAVLDPDLPLPGAEDGLHATHAQTGQGGEPIGEAVQPEAMLREALATGQAARIEACLRLPGLDPELAWQAVLELDRGGHHEPVARALQGMAVEALEARGRLVEALQQGRLELARRLLERGVSPGGLRLAALLTPASMAGAEAEALLRRCLAEGADGWAWHGRGSALHAAVRCGWVALADDLLARGVDPGAVDACGWTPLHHAAWRGEAGLVALLLRAGARLDRRTVDGRTALGLALRLGDAEVVDWLDWQGWKPPGRPLRELDLIEAAALGDADAVERLLAMGLAVSAQDAQGCTALLRASGGGHLDCVASLLEHGADPSIPARTGATCLSAAITQDRRAVVEYLLDHGADPDQRLPGGVTALMVAAALGLPDMLRVLLARGADPGCVDDDGNHALHALAHWGFSARERGRALDGWQLLLRADPDAIDRPRKDGLTPLLLLLGARSDPGHPVDESCLSAQLEVLLERGVDLGRCDARGMGPLHLCAQHGLLSVLRRLLRAGADRNLRDTLGRAPLDIAVQRGFVDLAVELGPEDGSRPLSMARFLRDR